MNNINRRSFLEKSSIGLGGLALAPFENLLASANRNDLPVGFQTFPIRDMLSKDFSGTLKTMSNMGYQLVEMCYPKGYASIGFGELAKIPTSTLRSIIVDSGLTCPSCHFGFGEFTDEVKLNESILFAHDLGIKQMVLSTFWLPKTATLNDYLLSADKMNEAAEKIHAAGMQAGFHNHSFEFVKLDGQLIYDALMSRFDPHLVKMQFQTEVINLGYKASDYFKKYPGRFFSAHLSDWTTDKNEVPIGNGIIDWDKFFQTAKTGGVETYFVEMSFDTLKESIHYLSSR